MLTAGGLGIFGWFSLFWLEEVCDSVIQTPFSSQSSEGFCFTLCSAVEYEAVVPDDVLDRVLVLPEEAGGGSALVDSADLANTRTSVDFETVHVGSTPAVQR